MERRATHRKNASTLLTARTKRTSVDSKTKDHGSRSKDKPADLALQNKMKRRMSFKSPSRKDSKDLTHPPYQNLSLLNYLLFKEKKGDLQIRIPSPPSRNSKALSRQGFLVLEILGKGGFGKVYKVEMRHTSATYAMK